MTHPHTSRQVSLMERAENIRPTFELAKKSRGRPQNFNDRRIYLIIQSAFVDDLVAVMRNEREKERERN